MSARALESGAELVRHAADRAAEASGGALDAAGTHRLPIQRSVDVAVPLGVAWQEFMALDALPEGPHTVTGIERDGSTLTGRTHGQEWKAEILDERERESFAWRSHAGSDCAGLVTFHELSPRLTRLEMNLDVVPTGLGESVALSTRLADRRAEAELRRFKARVELIDPDTYPEEERAADGSEPERAEPEAEEPEAAEPEAAEATEERGDRQGRDAQRRNGSGTDGRRKPARKRRSHSNGHNGGQRTARAGSRNGG